MGFVIVKYGRDGDRLWTVRHGITNSQLTGGHHIATDDDGNVIVVGAGFTTLKYSPWGRLQWEASHPGSIWALALDAAANIYVAGRRHLGTTEQLLAAKLDPLGNLLWDATYSPGPFNSAVAFALALDDAANVYAAGTTFPNSVSDLDFLTVKFVQTNAPRPPLVGIQTTRAATAEGRGWLSQPAVFTVTRGGETTTPLTVHYAIRGTASNGVDYAFIASSVVIPAGRRTASIFVRAIDDTRAERVESVRLELVPADAYRLSIRRHATVFILDNDHFRRR